MTTRVAFLRAVNLGRRKVANARLAAVVEGLGNARVWTYINSGNVVFEGTGGRAQLEARLERAFEAEFGFEVTTFVRSAAELGRVLEAQPFRVGAGDTYFVTFLKAAPTAAARAALEALSNDFDTLVVQGREVHWRMHGSSMGTKIPTRAWEKVIGRHTSTSRNVNMLTKLVAKIDERQG